MDDFLSQPCDQQSQQCNKEIDEYVNTNIGGLNNFSFSLTNFRARLVSMLKVQLGVLSKCLDTRALSLETPDCYDHLHELTAGISRVS